MQLLQKKKKKKTEEGFTFAFENKNVLSVQMCVIVYWNILCLLLICFVDIYENSSFRQLLGKLWFKCRRRRINIQLG